LIKRALDAAGALAGLILAALPMAVIAVLVRLRLGAPVLFVQPRPGLHGRIFRMYKFRTMREAAGADGLPLPDAKRLGALGRWLRASSLDELPELWNVLRGDMSLVGPRPLLTEYLPLYSAEQARRHEVRPGLTGWSQVNGRNAVDWDTRLAMDVWYVDNRTLALDLRIMLLTVVKVLRADGITQEGQATMQAFTGPAPGGGTRLGEDGRPRR
jgi:sugar transferase EpsL